MNHSLSEKLFAEAKTLMPGGVNSPVRAFSNVGATPPFIKRAKGSHIYDVDGNDYIDYVGSWGPMLLGHAHDAVIKAVADTAQNGLSFGAPCGLESELAKLREERDRIKATKEEVCPVCGNAVSGEKLEEHKRKAIDDIVSHAKGLSEELDKTKEKIELLNTYLNGYSLIDIEPLKQKLINFRTNDSIVPFELTEQGKTLQADIDAIVIPEVKMPEDAELKQKVADIKEKLKGLYMKKGLQSRLSSLKNDIEELRSEQRDKGALLAKYERQRQLVKEYKQEQMEIISHKVNDGLKSSYIECWSQQKDGTTVPDIVLKNKDGVNFATANGASRIVTTCDIQRFFCEKLGVSMPMFIDESSIIQTSNLPHYDGVQTFYLFCSDEPLKIESK